MKRSLQVHAYVTFLNPYCKDNDDDDDENVLTPIFIW